MLPLSIHAWGLQAFRSFSHTHTSLKFLQHMVPLSNCAENWGELGPLSCSALTERKSPSVPWPEPGFHSFLNINYRTEQQLWCWKCKWSIWTQVFLSWIKHKALWRKPQRVCKVRITETFHTHWNWEGPRFHSENCILKTMHNDLLRDYNHLNISTFTPCYI